MVWYIIFIWTETTKNYVSEVGCYLGVYAFYFLPSYYSKVKGINADLTVGN
jgi:hypothetical protein